MKTFNLTEFNLAEEGLKARGFDVQRFDDKIEPVPPFNMEIERHQLDVMDIDGSFLFDIICQTGSFGGDKGFLEVMNREMIITKDEDALVEGWLTAEEILRRLDAKKGG